MCGIFGIITEPSRDIEHALRAGTRALAHRGPDDEGIEIIPLPGGQDVVVGLGARRLAIQDLSAAGHQPMRDPATGNWLVFNGEIYNFREVRARLEKRGHKFSSAGDTEVLLKSYAEWGEGCLEHLAGMFAFAMWDAHRRRLFLARDRLGVKPLYYHEASGHFLFSSEVRSLLATGLVSRRGNIAGVASYLAYGAVQDPLTIVEGVHSLPPGHTLTWESGRLQIQRYWSLLETAFRPPATDSSEEAVKAVRERLLEAVSQRLIADVPLGIFLSGGVDSSSIVALVKEAQAGSPETFSVTFGDSEYSEAGYSRQVARLFGCRHHEINVAESRLREDTSRALGAMDQPTADGVNTYIVSQAVREAGMAVALSGVGGDEVFAGYSTFRSVPRMMTFARHAGWLQPVGRSICSMLNSSQTNRLTKTAALCARQYQGGHPYFLSRALFLPATIQALLPNASSRNSDGAARRGSPDPVGWTHTLDPVNQVSVFEGSTYMANMLLRDTDCMSMAHSLEVRGPFLDHRLWEFVLPLRGKLKLDSRLPKPLLLGAVGHCLPKESYLRPKMGFTLPFDRWLRNGLAATVEQDLSQSAPPELLPFGPGPGQGVWNAFLAGKTSWSRPWALYVLKRWFRENLGD